MEAEGVAGKAGGIIQILKIPRPLRGCTGRRGELGNSGGWFNKIPHLGHPPSASQTGITTSTSSRAATTGW